MGTQELPTAEAFIRQCLANNRCTRIGLKASLSRAQKTIVARLQRNGQDFWDGNENRSELRGHTDSYPRIDLIRAGVYQAAESITLEAFLADKLPSSVNTRLAVLLEKLELYLRPAGDSYKIGREEFIPISLYAPKGMPEWLLGVEDLRMSGNWRAFIDPQSYERKVIDALRANELCARRIIQLEAEHEQILERLGARTAEFPGLHAEAARLFSELIAKAA